MRIISLFRKTWIENIRDWKILILTLTFAPLFVLLMYFYVDESTQNPYRVVVINHDVGVSLVDQGDFNAGSDLILEMTGVEDAEGKKILEVKQGLELAAARKQLMNNAVDLVVEIPERFSEVLLSYSQGNQPAPAVVKTYGDPMKANTIMAAVWSDMIAYEYAAAAAGLKIPLEIQVNTVSGNQTLNEFELYVPALLGLALIMLMFTAAASLIKEKDKGTIIRLRLSNMTTFEWLMAVSLTQVIIGMLAMAVTFATAVALGYQTSGSLVAVLIVGLLSSFSIIAISVIVAAYLRTIFDLLTIGCFPFFILMFFSGGMFPLPPLRLFTIGDRAININDVLPTTHAINALSKILNYDAGLSDVVFELGAIAVLTIVLFAFGIWLFTSRQMEAVSS
ncbi:MAG TPA: ABC transporter permease [Anaerolineales bacterium]|nr:ABC transporter permease [Anaerolineales bacterium]